MNDYINAESAGNAVNAENGSRKSSMILYPRLCITKFLCPGAPQFSALSAIIALSVLSSW
jgi:hypothetical protein